MNLYIINANGTGKTQLPQGNRAAWSPKGGLIAFDTGDTKHDGALMFEALRTV